MQARLEEAAGNQRLTPREVQVVELIAQAMRNKEIAAALGVASETVQVHVKNVLAKLGVNDRIAAVNVARAPRHHPREGELIGLQRIYSVSGRSNHLQVLTATDRLPEWPPCGGVERVSPRAGARGTVPLPIARTGPSQGVRLEGRPIACECVADPLAAEPEETIMPQRGLIVGGVLVGLLIAAARPGFAQAGRAEIHGTVYDQDKAVLPGVTVTVIHEGQGTERSTITGPRDGTSFPRCCQAPTRSEVNCRASRARNARDSSSPSARS